MAEEIVDEVFEEKERVFKKEIPLELEPLVEVARRYRTYEEFAKADIRFGEYMDKAGVPYTKVQPYIYYRAIDSTLRIGLPGKYFSSTPTGAGFYGKKVIKVRINPDANIIDSGSPDARHIDKIYYSGDYYTLEDIRKEAKRLGIDGIAHTEALEIHGTVIFNQDIIEEIIPLSRQEKLEVELKKAIRDEDVERIKDTYMRMLGFKSLKSFWQIARREKR